MPAAKAGVAIKIVSRASSSEPLRTSVGDNNDEQNRDRAHRDSQDIA